MKNTVVAGKHRGRTITRMLNLAHGFDCISLVHDEEVVSMEVLDADVKKSAGSIVGRGLVGGVLLGPLGMLAGGITAKNKSQILIKLTYSDGNYSKINVDDKIYKELLIHFA